ncbi:hypothetical protein TGAMA5MH_08981 [Trichoderma gamsii]|uniref:Uncharacterized protein n=1 Tax=Trichoderma gamsii TaxID=398673 RepID=A0A2K0T0T7_9HYPO|nr:hypothetical protein TGAMA5MH_08981 [Trichoderma gamsii]
MAPAEIVPKDYLGLINDKTEREWTPPTPVMENTEYDGQNVQRCEAQTARKQESGNRKSRITRSVSPPPTQRKRRPRTHRTQPRPLHAEYPTSRAQVEC